MVRKVFSYKPTAQSALIKTVEKASTKRNFPLFHMATLAETVGNS